MKTNDLKVYIIPDELCDESNNFNLSEFNANKYLDVVSHTKSKGESKQEVNIQNEILMVNTVTGLIIVKVDQIVYFQYSQSKRLWEIVLNDESRIILKRKSTADIILGISPQFIQINLHHILNMNYFSHIIDGQVTLTSPYDMHGTFKISKFHLSRLQEKFIIL